ncbi:hypothetical protein [Actinoplanes sp. TFC3]|uniref:hypothetical protein n=1 Tax=Actinoplanes sp. TFC3 TaxID=1710355 RepID=UPI000831DB4D|nr:hypothetical protein [Actinoplanes sp. TFC3]
MELAVSNGVLFIEDADPETALEPVDIGEAAVTAGDGWLIAKVMQPVDGHVLVVVTRDDGSGESQEKLPVAYFDGTITTRLGRLVVRDVPEENKITAYMNEGPCRIRLFVDTQDFPEQLEILLPAEED